MDLVRSMGMCRNNSVRVMLSYSSRCEGVITETKRLRERCSTRELIIWVTEGSEARPGRSASALGTLSGICGATVCIELSTRGSRAESEGALVGREGLVGGFISRRVSVRICSVCVSSRVSNAAFSEPRFRHVVSSVETKEVGYVIMGSLSHLNESCVRANGLMRHMFPVVGVHFMTVASGCSSSGGSTSLVITIAGVTGSLCTGSVSGGVSSDGRRTVRGNVPAKGITCNCGMIFGRGGIGMVIRSGRTTSIME